MIIENVTTPTEALTVGEARSALRIDAGTDDGYLAGLLLAAREMLEMDTSRRFGERSMRMTIDCWPADGEITIPVGPVAAVTAISYDDAALAATAFGGHIVRWRHELARIRLATGQSWPALGDDGQIRITFTCGENPISEIARQAMLLLTGHWYANREIVSSGNIGNELPFGYAELAKKLKLQWL